MIYVSICYYVEFYVKFFDVRGPPCGSLIKPCLQPGKGLWFGVGTINLQEGTLTMYKTTLYEFQPLT